MTKEQSTEPGPQVTPIPWRTLLWDLTCMMSAESLPTPRMVVRDIDNSQASVALDDIAAARVWAARLGERSPALASTFSHNGQPWESYHARYRGWVVILTGSDPVPSAEQVAAAALVPDVEVPA